MTTALLQTVLDRVLESEGGVSDHPADRGGLTAYGLTRPFLKDVTQRDWTDAEIVALTREQALAVYTLWAALRKLDQLPDDLRLAWAVIDYAVLHGERPAIRALQRQLGVLPDGLIGPVTIAALQRTPAQLEAVRLGIMADRLEALGHVIAQPGQAVFALGWLRRVARHLRG